MTIDPGVTCPRGRGRRWRCHCARPAPPRGIDPWAQTVRALRTGIVVVAIGASSLTFSGDGAGKRG